jgi:hypothetical protein
MVSCRLGTRRREATVTRRKPPFFGVAAVDAPVVRTNNAESGSAKHCAVLKLCLVARERPRQKRWTVFIQQVNFDKNLGPQGVRRD